jgi:hypothetical protein
MDQLCTVLEKMMIVWLYNFFCLFQGHQYLASSEFAQQNEFETANCHSNVTSSG